MLALPPHRRQHPQSFYQQSQPSYPSPSHTSPPAPQTFALHNLHNLSQLSSSQTALHQKLQHYFESQQQQQQQQQLSHPGVAAAETTDATLANPFMSGAYDFGNPAIRIQQSTPTPTPAATLPSTFAHTSMLPGQSATGPALQNWNTLASNNAPATSQALQTPRTSKTHHHRASSSSSIASDASQYQATASVPSYSPYSNHLPTPSHTPTHDSFVNNANGNGYSNFTPMTSDMGMNPALNAHLSMKQALMDQNTDDDVPNFAHSARHSVVSDYGHDSPVTPHTAQSDDFETDRFKMPPNDLRQQQITGLDGNFYDGSALLPQQQQQQQQQPMPAAKPNPQLLSPYGGPNAVVQRALQSANNARSQSPASSVSRGVSPFRHNSPLYQNGTGYHSPRVRVTTVAEAREQKLEADAAHALKHNIQADEDLAVQPKTISPKDALLDYRDADEDSKMPLFPDGAGGASEYGGSQFRGGNQYSNATQPTFDTATSTGQQPYRGSNWSTPQFAGNYATSTGAAQPASFPFAPPAIQGNIHGLPYSAAAQYRSTTNMPAAAADPTPDFPAHLTSMESSASEAEPQNSQNSHMSSEQLQKPASSAADTGTYTCTYHGCTLRFETPQKLQKHKREGHRNANAPALGSSMPSAALLERNSQAGPHKCERINPTTGKPCNTIFSRPYDLTRHEDTIHNARKQKVRCALCVEDKTFSRNDALTRHMRVVHPEVDFPGKHRRRGGS